MSEELADVSRKGGETLARFDTPRGEVQAVRHGDAVHIRHQCKTIARGRRLVNDPALQLDAGHTVTSWEPLTVTPSVGCSDCGLHGFITAGAWVDAGTPPLEV